MKLFFFVLLSFFFFSALEAEPSFVVYHCKGNIRKATSKNILKKGDQLFIKDIITLGEGSKLVLVCSNYQIIQLGKKGSYPVKNLLFQCKQSGSYSSSYFKYVWEQLTHPHGKPEQDPEAYMKNVGAVSRGCNEVAFAMQVDTIQYSSGMLPLQWWAAYNKPTLAVFEQPMDGEAVKKIELTSKVPLPLEELGKNLLPGIYYWQIMGEDWNSCERKYLKIWDKSSYSKAIQALMKCVPITSPAETAYGKAFVLHENHFLAEAHKYYKLAASLNPGNSIYKTSLNKFYETTF